VVLLYVWDKYGFKNPRFVECSKKFNGPPLLPIVGNALTYLNLKAEGKSIR
jgi:hypothetical protein